MGEIFFVRHGQASFGTADYDRLSPLGHQQSEWLGAHLAANAQKFDRVICGSLRRHRETLAGLRKNMALGDVIEDPRLNEMNYHSMEDAFRAANPREDPRTAEALEAMFREVMHAWDADTIRGVGESLAHFQARVMQAIAAHALPGQKILVVSSGGPKCVLMRHVLNLGIAALTELILKTYNASYSRFEVTSARLRLLSFNAVPHLETRERLHALTVI